MKHLLLTNMILLLFASLPLMSKQNYTEQMPLTLRGRIVASDTQNPLSNASVTVKGLNASSVSNQDGYFILRIPESAKNSTLIIRYVGYENVSIPIETLINNTNNDIVMNPSIVELDELHVLSGDGRQIVTKALQLIPKNYPDEPNMMVAFYRESIKKNSNYISLVEAVLDVYKSSYKGFEEDQARIYIGRKATDISPRDTVLMKFQGGISAALMLDLAKHPEIVFGEKGEDYTFRIDRLININNKPHYAISFEPLMATSDILFRGILYIDTKSHAIARAEFNMNVENKKDAVNLFIRRKPAKMKVEVTEAKYISDFTENDGKWFFNYSSTQVSFKIRWTNRFFGLFRTNYTIGSEIAITDRYKSDANKFPRKERIRSSDVIAEKVEHFHDPQFWGDYNVIEPDIEISKAINKLSGKLIRRKE